MSIETMRIHLPFALHNVERYDKPEERLRSAKAAIRRMKGGFGGLNEVHPADVKTLETYALNYGLKMYRVGTNAIFWDHQLMKLDFKRYKIVAPGGHIGADMTKAGPDNRPVGPNRLMLQCGFSVHPIDFPFQVNLTHLPHQAFTRKKWKIRLWKHSVQEGGEFVADALDTHPNGIIFGDLNSPHYVNWPLVPDIVIPTPPTHGPRRYDQVAKFGNLMVVSIEEFYTPSDHDGVEGMVILNIMIRKSEKPKPSLPKPGSRVNWRKYGAPLAHPWAKRSKRFWRRHPILRKRVMRWRNNYLRRMRKA